MSTPDENVLARTEDRGDSDSAFGDEFDNYLSTFSMGTSVLQYRQENGRSYHAYKDGSKMMHQKRKYMFPNDELENNREDLSHHLFLLTFNNKLAFAPIGNQIHRILDVGTGTGIWAIDFAEEHPESMVLGVDLSPIQPLFVPPNCMFEVDDLDEEWTFRAKFDFIHARMVNQGLSDWPRFFNQAFDNLTNGGFIEVQDMDIPVRSDDGTLPPDCALSRWCSLMLQAGQLCGPPDSVAPRCKSLMLEAGFVDVVELQFKWPTNPWPADKSMKELGMWHQVNQADGLEGATMAMFTRVLGWTQLQVQEFLVEVKKNTRDRSIHAYWPLYVVYGRKP